MILKLTSSESTQKLLSAVQLPLFQHCMTSTCSPSCSAQTQISPPSQSLPRATSMHPWSFPQFSPLSHLTAKKSELVELDFVEHTHVWPSSQSPWMILKLTSSESTQKLLSAVQLPLFQHCMTSTCSPSCSAQTQVCPSLQSP